MKRTIVYTCRTFIHGIAVGAGMGLGLWIVSELSSMSVSITAVNNSKDKEQ